MMANASRILLLVSFLLRATAGVPRMCINERRSVGDTSDGPCSTCIPAMGTHNIDALWDVCPPIATFQHQRIYAAHLTEDGNVMTSYVGLSADDYNCSAQSRRVIHDFMIPLNSNSSTTQLFSYNKTFSPSWNRPFDASSRLYRTTMTNQTIDIIGQNLSLHITNASLIGQGPHKNGFQSNSDEPWDTSLAFSGFGKTRGAINSIHMMNLPYNTYIECVYASPISIQTTQNNMDFTCLYLFMDGWNAVLCVANKESASKYSRGQLQFVNDDKRPSESVWLEAKDFSMNGANEQWTILIHPSNANDRIELRLNETTTNENYCVDTIINGEKVERCMQGLKVQGGGYAMKSVEHTIEGV